MTKKSNRPSSYDDTAVDTTEVQTIVHHTEICFLIL